MLPMSTRKSQATSVILSSWVVVFLVIGIILEEWVELVSKTTNKISVHNPWMTCCTTIWPEDGLKMIRIMMMSILSISFLSNFILGLQFTYIIPQNKCIYLIITLFSFFTGTLLFSALLLYYGMLKKGLSMYFSSFKITWVPFTAYIAIILLFACGVLSLMQYKVFMNTCTCLEIHKSAKECKDPQISGNTIQVIPLKESTVIPRSIVRVHSISSREDTMSRPQVQGRRVTWAL